MRFEMQAMPLAGLKLIERKPIGDNRGFLERLYCAQELSALLPNSAIAQVNLTRTHRRGMVRGMHYQVPPHAEAKFVSCIRGQVFDVAVDLRRGSPTFLRWHAVILSDTNHRTLYIPPGFAHGLQTLDENCELLYLHTASYNPDAERGLHPQDQRVGIAWPEPIAQLSERDASQAPVSDDFGGIEL